MTDTQLETKVRTDVSFNDLIEMNDQAVLLSLREGTTQCYFAVGDMCDKYIQMLANAGYKLKSPATGEVLYVTSTRIQAAIGHYFGKSGRTVRDYYEVAITFPQEVRDEFKILPYATFRVAKSFGKRWREVLEYAADNPQMPTSTVEWNLRLQEPAQDVEDEEDDSEVTVGKHKIVLEALLRLVDAINRLFNGLELSRGAAMRAADLLADFRRFIDQIADEIVDEPEE